MADNTLLVAALSLVGGSGLAGSIVALVKVRPESGAILVKSATDVVIIQREAMTDMQRRLADVEGERDAMRDRLAGVEGERDAMRRRVAELEANVRALQRRADETDA